MAEELSKEEQDKLAEEWAAAAEAEADGGDGGDAGGEDQDKLAEEWAAAAESDAEGGGESAAEETRSARVLNQDEIDNLLGFDGDTAQDSAADSGINAIINSALVSYERLPMLEVVFDRLVRLMTTSMRNFTSDNVEVSLDNVSSIRFGDYLNSIPLPAILGVFKAEEWDNYGLITVDSALIYSIVDVLLGGRRGTAAMRIEGRPYTTIERNLVERMIRVVLGDMCTAFEPLNKVQFSFDRLETNPRFAAIARAANAAIQARLRIDMEDRGGRMDLLFPYATLEPVRELLLQMFMGEKFGRDSIWEGHLASELWNTDIEIDGLLDEQTLNLYDVLQWRVGDRLMLNVSPDAPIKLRCGEISMFAGRMGSSGGRIAVRIDRHIKK